MKHKLLTMIFFLFLPFAAFCQSQGVKKVAVLEVVDRENNISTGVKLLLRSSLSKAITDMPDYEAFDRVDIDQIMKEENFQHTGMVSDATRTKIGNKTGASYILVAEAAEFDAENLVITAKIIEVESAKMLSVSQVISGMTPKEFNKACSQLAASLFNHQIESEIDFPVAYSNLSDSTIQVGNLSFKMIYVQGGTFTMGATSEQGSDPYENESPVHQVTLSDYYIGEYEVTQELWMAVMCKDNPSYINPSYNKQGGNYPVEQVSYSDIQKFLSMLNQLTGKTFALPTEAQWEFAARGGEKSKGYKYSGSNNIEYVSWCNDNSSSTQPVGLKQSNELGIYDMSGNVCEWCSDWYEFDYYSSSPSKNPTGPSPSSERVLRGGSCNNSAISCRVSYRSKSGPDNWNLNNGFRIVMLLN